MRCRDLASVLLDRELSGLAPEREATLATHLADCPACARRAALERMLTEDLLSLRATPRFAVDVTQQVLAALPHAGPTPDEHPSPAELRWAGAAAAAGAIALATGLLLAVRQSPVSLGSVRRGLSAALALVRPLGEAAVAIASAGWDAVSALGTLLTPVASLLTRIEPIALASVALAALLMMTTILLVVGRDLRSAGGTPRGGS